MGEMTLVEKGNSEFYTEPDHRNAPYIITIAKMDTEYEAKRKVSVI